MREKQKPRFAVVVTRTVTEYFTIEVDADNKEHAKTVALDQAGNVNFHDGTQGEPSYDVDGVTKIR